MTQDSVDIKVSILWRCLRTHLFSLHPKGTGIALGTRGSLNALVERWKYKLELAKIPVGPRQVAILRPSK